MYWHAREGLWEMIENQDWLNWMVVIDNVFNGGYLVSAKLRLHHSIASSTQHRTGQFYNKKYWLSRDVIITSRS